ncbi:hypothetical protein BGZ50_008428 [Haplosporangium sp. Z 11]|nr:hypothetical protein BGZ50_008428 [Haplosporangium sp. Z 11]
MTSRSSHSHIDPHTLDSLLQSTLHYQQCPYSSTSPALDQDPSFGLNPTVIEPVDFEPNKTQRDVRRRGQAPLDLNLNRHLSSVSSSSPNTANDDTTFTSSASSHTHSNATPLPPPIPPRPSHSQTSTSHLFLSAAASPTSTISPTSPLKVAFSCPNNHRHDPSTVTTTFSSYYDQLSPKSKLQFQENQEQCKLEQQQQQQEPSFNDGDDEACADDEANTEQHYLQSRNGSHSQQRAVTVTATTSRFSVGSLRSSSPMQPRRTRTSTGGALSSSSVIQPDIHLPPFDSHNSFVQQLPGTQPQQLQVPRSGDLKINTMAMIPIHVRYVPKDLWVQVDLPHDMPVHKARDLILAKCRLTSPPPHQTPPEPPAAPILTTSESETDPDQTLVQSSPELHHESLSLDVIGKYPGLSRGVSNSSCGSNSTKCGSDDQYLSVDTSIVTEDSSCMSASTLHSDGGSSTFSFSGKGRRPSRAFGFDDDDNSIDGQESTDDEEAELRAEELMADDMFPQSPPSSRASLGNNVGNGAFGLTDSVLQSLQGISFVSSRLRQESQTSFCTNNSSSNEQQNIQLKRLIAYSLLHKKDDSHGTGTAGDRLSKDGGVSAMSRLGNIPIPGWTQYRNRQNTNGSGKKHIEDVDASAAGSDVALKSEAQKADSSAWKASFGLFWVAAGHWLDDSRLVSSYNLQPHCLLELQVRSSYIQLPPTGTSLSYYDHYAEGVLYKMSKKSGPVTKLTSPGKKDSTGVWKERWVVLQGKTLLIFQKKKDTSKKVIDLEIPLTVTATIPPLSPRHSFKRASFSVAVAMSTSMITLTVSSDPNVPQLCFRATTESELNHWIRIFNSLNCSTLYNLSPPSDPSALVSPVAPPIQVPPPLPPLPSVPPPTTVDSVVMSTTKRDRHHSYSAAYKRSTGGWGEGSWVAGAGMFFSERKRSHTSQIVSATPSINPALITSAAAALSNLKQSGKNSSSDNSVEVLSSGDEGYHRSGSSCSSRESVTGPISTPITLKKQHRRTHSHFRSSSPVSLMLGSLLNDRDVTQSPRLSLSGQGPNKGGSSLSRQNSSGSMSESLFRYHLRNLIQDPDAPEKPRQRNSTDPGQRFRVKSMSSQRSSQQMFRNYIYRSKAATPEPLSDIASISEVASVDGMDNYLSSLEPACQELLKASAVGSSAAPLYSGYVWLYIPNTMNKRDDQYNMFSMLDDASVRTSTPPLSRDHSVASFSMAPTAMASRTANISMSKASGRYVKCFAAINEKGQFQWVEVKQDESELCELEGRSQEGDDITPAVPTRYGLQLSSAPVQSSNRMIEGAAGSVHTQSTSMTPTSTDPTKPTRSVQASMAHKLRLYFFCIKISPSSLAEVMIEMTETPSISSSPTKTTAPAVAKSASSTPAPPPLSRKSSRRIRNRFSAPVASAYTPMSAPLPSLPSTTMTASMTKSRTRSGAQPSLDFIKNNSNPTWPSMYPLHEERPLNHDREKLLPSSRSSTPPPLAPRPSMERTKSRTLSSHQLQIQPPPIPPRPVMPSQSKSLFAENWTKTRSAPPGSIFPNANKNASLQAKGETVKCVAGKVVVIQAGTSEEQQSENDNEQTVVSCPMVLSPIPVTPVGSLSPTGTSHVLSLAQGLQKAMKEIHSSGEQKSSTTTASLPDASASPSHKPSLSEITAKKRASLQNGFSQDGSSSTSLSRMNTSNMERERSRLKLIGGLNTLEEACENEENSEAGDEHRERNSNGRGQKTLSGGPASSVAATLRMLLQCPFMEQSESQDAEGRMYVTLKGYTETEEAWKELHSALERFVDGPIKDQKSALPPVHTLIPSYHAPRRSEKTQKEKATDAATALLNGVPSSDAPSSFANSVSGFSTPPMATSTAHASSTTPTARPSLGRSSSTSRSSTPVGFSRHSVQLASGTGYGPSRSFADLGNTSSTSTNVSNSIINKTYKRSSHSSQSSLSCVSAPIRLGGYNNSNSISRPAPSWASYGASGIALSGSPKPGSRMSVSGLTLGHQRFNSHGNGQGIGHGYSSSLSQQKKLQQQLLKQKQQQQEQQEQQQHRRNGSAQMMAFFASGANANAGSNFDSPLQTASCGSFGSAY